MLRNGCDRLAAGLTNIATRCFAEDYMTVNPQLATSTFVTNGNSSNYHSLQTQATLRPTAGLSLQGTYTWSKNLGISGTATDPTNRNADYTYTGGDRRHEFRMNGTFELPIGPNKLLMGNSSGWLARVLERWQTGMIFNWNSGAPTDIEAPDMLYDNGVPDIVGSFPTQREPSGGTGTTTRRGHSTAEPTSATPTRSSPLMTLNARTSATSSTHRAITCSTQRTTIAPLTPSL